MITSVSLPFSEIKTYFCSGENNFPAQISNGIDRGWRQFFDCPIEFYCDYEISIFKYISNKESKKTRLCKILEFILNYHSKNDEIMFSITSMMEIFNYYRIRNCFKNFESFKKFLKHKRIRKMLTSQGLILEHY